HFLCNRVNLLPHFHPCRIKRMTCLYAERMMPVPIITQVVPSFHIPTVLSVWKCTSSHAKITCSWTCGICIADTSGKFYRKSRVEISSIHRPRLTPGHF